MTPFDYITDTALIAVVVLQMRVRTLTLRSLLLPLGLVAGAGLVYLRPVPLSGNNAALIAVLVAAGLLLVRQLLRPDRGMRRRPQLAMPMTNLTRLPRWREEQAADLPGHGN